MPSLFCFGLGYSASWLARELRAEGWAVAGTSRQKESSRKESSAASDGIERFIFDREHPLSSEALALLTAATHVLVSVPPDERGDPVLDLHRVDILRARSLRWLGYLSTTGVYGDTGGAWVDENSPVQPSQPRSRRRAEAERGWLALGPDGTPVHLFRLAGIYGPGRSPLEAIRAGTAKRVDRPEQLFSRIHVADIDAVLRASMAQPRTGGIYNVCDDEPAAQERVVAYAAALLGVAPPPLQPFDEAALSPMARSFYADNRRVRNDLIKGELVVTLRYPSYREGLAAILGG